MAQQTGEKKSYENASMLRNFFIASIKLKFCAEFVTIVIAQVILVRYFMLWSAYLSAGMCSMPVSIMRMRSSKKNNTFVKDKTWNDNDNDHLMGKREAVRDTLLKQME